MSYAVNEDGTTVYDVQTGTAICVCGPDFLDQDYSKFRSWPDEVMQRAHAALIAQLLNNATSKPSQGDEK